MVFTESVQSPPNLSISQIFAKFRDFHLKSWPWDLVIFGTFCSVICLITPVHESSTCGHFWPECFWILFYGPLGVQSWIEISKNDNFRAQYLNCRRIWTYARSTCITWPHEGSFLANWGHILLAWSRWNPIHRFQNSILTFWK